MRLPLLLSHYKHRVLPSLIRDAPNRNIANITREYLQRRSLPKYPHPSDFIRRVLVQSVSVTVGGVQLGTIPPTPQHRQGPGIQRLGYAPMVSIEGVAVRAYLPPGSPLPIRKMAVGPTVRKVPHGPTVRKVSLGPTIKKTYHDYSSTWTAAGAGEEIPPTEYPMYLQGEAAPALERALSLEGHVIQLPELKTTYVDTHCHLFTTLQMLKDGLQDETIPKDAVNTFVETIFPKQAVACVDIHCDLPLSDNHEKAVALGWPEHFKYYFAIGAHPHVANDYTDEVHERIVVTMSNPSCVAWGECGLDYFKSPLSTHETQQAVFKRQLTAAVALNKPIIIHTRNADADTLACIRETVPRDHRMHIHCFTSGKTLARAILSAYPNSFIGLTGVISYAGTDHIAELITSGELPLDRILLETDSPYMVPKLAYGWIAREKPEFRKKVFVVSHAGMIPFTAEILTGLVNQWRAMNGEANVRLEDVLDITRRNAAKMYGIDV